jgi:predicted  nucleic acid-binding Zn-ribbon protein
MDIKKIITWAPILLAFIGSLYTGVNVVSKLNNTIEQHTITITSLGNQLDAMDTKYTIEVKNLTQKYTEGREELLKEMTQAYAMIAEVRVKAEALRDGSFKLASEAELRALEQSYYKLYDSINQLTYDLKDMKRQLTGGY